MTFWISILVAMLLFTTGVVLSAFFSGSETGFYRVSFLRLSIDAHAGDPVARRLMWFVQNPPHFVATTLVGNNIANYLTTLAISLAVGAVLISPSVLVEVGATLVMTPVIFLFGELMPKNLYLRAPTKLLRRGQSSFRLCYVVLWPLSQPLIWLTRLFETISRARPHQLDLVLGRHRLQQVMSRGHEYGLLTDEQGELVHGLLHDASRLAAEVMTPPDRIMGVDETASREHIIEHARSLGLSLIPVRRGTGASDWFAYYRLIDLESGDRSVEQLLREMPRIRDDATRLSALLTLRDTGHSLGVVVADGNVVGLLTERALIEHFMHPTGSRRRRRSQTSRTEDRT